MQVHTHLISLLLAKLAHERNVNICDASALDSLEALETAELLAHIIQIILEVVVDAFFHRVIEAALILRIPVSKVVAPARGREVELTKIIGRTAAAVVLPDKTRGVFCALGGDEVRDAVLEHELLKCSGRARAGRGRLWCRRRFHAILDTALDILIPWAKASVKIST